MSCSTTNFQKSFMFDNMFAGTRLQQSCDGEHVYLFFFGKTSFLSNFASSPMSIDGTSFSCAEQAFQYFKAKFFNEDEIAKQILEMDNPSEMAITGQHVFILHKPKQSEWNDVAVDTMEQILRAKFSQNEELKSLLKRTSPCMLVESNPYDRVFGNGLGIGNAKSDCHHNWPGQNVMGKILENIRSKL